MGLYMYVSEQDRITKRKVSDEYGDYKQKADDLHKRKIDICDEVFVLNVGGYIGQSTRIEIDYALSIGRPVKYLETIQDSQ